MTVCKYFSKAIADWGFEHPQRGGNQAQTQFGNRFAPLNSGQSSQARAPDGPQYPGLTEEIIQRDLTSELPLWILSCYGPGRDAPEQLFGGPQREQSFEEMRMHYMLGAMNGNPQGALNDIQTLYQNAHQQIQHTLSNIPAAIRYVIESQEKHPNRIDICNNPQAGSAGGGLTSNAFGAAPPQVTNPFGAAPVTPANPATSALAQASVLGQKPSSFATPAFGQPAQPANSAFGQTSALGASNNVFARPSQPGAGGFGQPSVLGGGSGLGGKVFGQGVQQPAFGQTGFPQTPATQPGPGFGQPASLGANPNPFGAPQQPAANPFGQPQQPVQNTNMLGTPGMNATLATNNPFGAPSPAKNIFGTQGAATTPGPFGQLQQQQQQAQQTINPFGNPLAATEPPVTNNPFGQPATSQVGSPFGGIPAVGAVVSQVAAQAAPAAAAAAVAAATQGQGPYGQNATRQHPDISTYSAKNPDGTLRMFKGKPVMYDTPKGQDKPVPCIRQFDGSMVRIWMPNGAPAYTKETEAEDPSKYDDPAVQQQWAFVYADWNVCGWVDAGGATKKGVVPMGLLEPVIPGTANTE